MSKTLIGLIVVFCDIMSVLVFLIAISILERCEERKAKQIESEVLKVKDFTINIKLQPKKEEYKTV
jgi:hypothetical protein